MAKGCSIIESILAIRPKPIYYLFDIAYGLLDIDKRRVGLFLELGMPWRLWCYDL